MNKRISRTLVSLILVAALLLGPTAAEATGIPVVDLVAWAQRILAYYKQVQQVEAQIKQVELAAKQLESFGQGGNWTDLNGLLGQIDQLFNTYSTLDQNLGYLKVGVEDIFRETFPGYSPPEIPSVPADVRIRIERSHETLALIMQALNRLTWNNTHSQIALGRAIELSKVASTQLEETEVSNMFASIAITEEQKQLQAQLLAANAATLGVAIELQNQATADAARDQFFASAADAPSPGYGATSGFTGIPSTASTSIF